MRQMKPDLRNPGPLKAQRKDRGWSQTKVAEALGVDISTVRRWEQGHVVPYPYHRQKLSALFNKTPEELGLPSDAHEDTTVEKAPLPDVPLDSAKEASSPADPAIPETPGSVQSPLGRDSLFRQAQTRLSPRSLWDIGLGSMRYLLTIRPANRFSWHSMLMVSAIMLAVLLILSILPAFSRLPFPRIGEKQAFHSSESAPKQNNHSPPSYSLKILNVDPSLQETAQHLQKAFDAVYPQLANRFARDPGSAAIKTVTLTLLSDLPSPASTSGTTIALNADWIRQHPTQMGLLTHELTLVVQAYSSEGPPWFPSGMADYARSVYGPADDDGWSLPNTVQPQDSYEQGGEIAARFLLWLEQYTGLDIVDRLHRALQTRQSFSGVFYHLTHRTVDDLWRQYQVHPAITLFPQQLYKTAISRKPLFYQSSFRIQRTDPIIGWQRRETKGLYLSNFAMQVDITIISGGAGGFYFRSESDANYYAVFLYSDGAYVLQHATQSLTANFSSAIRQGYNQANRLTVIAQKHTIYLYVNGQFITQLDHSASNYGTVGLMTWGPSTEVKFEKLQVF